MERPEASKTDPLSLLRTHLRIGLGGLSPLLFSWGCDLGSGPPALPASLEPVAGSNQSATVGKSVAVPPAVRVLNKKGKPLKGREVAFSPAAGSGLVSGNLQTTDENGVATVGDWILGKVAGTQTLEARVEGLPPLVFSATANAGDPATMTARSAST